MRLSSFIGLYESMYTDKLNVFRYVEEEQADGTLVLTLPNDALYVNLKCRISVKSLDNSEGNEYDTNPQRLQVKIFTNPGNDVQKGDKLVAQRIDGSGSVVAAYEGTAGLPFKYDTHQEILFAELGDA